MSIKEDSISNIETTSTNSTFSSSATKGRFFLIERLGKIEDDEENFESLYSDPYPVESVESAESNYTVETNQKDRIRVVVRVRPKTKFEYNIDNREILKYEKTGLEIEVKSQYRKFAFDAVIGPSAKQNDVFEACGIKRLVNMAIEGYMPLYISKKI